MAKTKQQWFDLVVEKLSAQKQQSYINGVGCEYLGPNGTKCAVGHCIPDELYHPKLEGIGVAFLVFGKNPPHYKEDRQAPIHVLRATSEHLKISDLNIKNTASFWFCLQSIHDRYIVSDWPHHWRLFAERWNLTYNGPAQFEIDRIEG